MIKNRLKIQSFNDGIVRVYDVINGAEAGSKPKDVLSEKAILRYKRRTVGINRYYTALQANAKINQLIRCLLLVTVSPQDVVVLDGLQYRIEQVQYPEDVHPPVMDLSLSRLERNYEFA